MEDLFSPYLPENFDSFWHETVEECEAVSVDFSRTSSELQPLPSHEVELLEFTGMAGRRIKGWIATPESPVGAFLWIPAYGRESHLPNKYSTREGMISASFNLHGLGAFLQEEYDPKRGYFSKGIADPHTWVFRRMTQDCLISLRVLAEQAGVERSRISAAGLSQGGGMAIWAGARSNLVRSIVADLPFLSAMRHTFSQQIYRYPLKEITDFAETLPGGMEAVLRTIAYFDTVNQATRVRKPTLVSLGLRDPAVRPDTVRAVYRALPSEKKLVEYESGHDWNPKMIEADRDWMTTK
ncbi:MAG TPA: acetylxylan esterase [Fimbriimonadales bacterium]|nr:acetylxylan esterase [Fimbriimonadales bacterium]